MIIYNMVAYIFNVHLHDTFRHFLSKYGSALGEMLCRCVTIYRNLALWGHIFWFPIKIWQCLRKMWFGSKMVYLYRKVALTCHMSICAKINFFQNQPFLSTYIDSMAWGPFLNVSVELVPQMTSFIEMLHLRATWPNIKMPFFHKIVIFGHQQG